MQALLAVGLFAQLGAAVPADSVDALRDRARSAEARYERLSRQLASLSWSGGASYDCDEIVGRFCLRFDPASVQPEAADEEVGRVVDARREAVEAFRRLFSAAPTEHEAAGPLVRLLIRDGRAAEAASAAGAFAALSPDSLWGDLLQGFAHHAAGAGEIAGRHFMAALGRMPDEERRLWLDPSWILHPAERRAVKRSTPDARSDYERRFWLLADPFWITAPNERWNEHIARHIEARLLAMVPPGAGMLRWGDDMDQLTVRYGTPVARSRQPGRDFSSPGLVEYWDTAQRAFAHVHLSDGLAEQPDPGVEPLLYDPAARSAYAMRTVDRVLELTHQATRLMRGDSILLRIDAEMPIASHVPGGSAGNPARYVAGLFAHDTAFTRHSAVTDSMTFHGDTARFSLTLVAPGGPMVYSVELLGDSASLSGRARYAIAAHVTPNGPIVSDLIVARPHLQGEFPDSAGDPDLRPFGSLVFHGGDTLGIYAEVYRLAGGRAVDIQVALESAERPGALGRLAAWVGRGIGLVEPADEPRVAWRGEAADDVHVVALNVPLPRDRDGLHELVLQITDPATGERSESRRRILIR